MAFLFARSVLCKAGCNFKSGKKSEVDSLEKGACITRRHHDEPHMSLIKAICCVAIKDIKLITRSSCQPHKGLHS